MKTASMEFKPKIFKGDYLKCVKYFLEMDILEFLSPKILWIDCYTIPILDLIKKIRNHPRLADQFYFLQFYDLEIYENILNSCELYSIQHQGFSTLIINLPEYITVPNEFKLLINKLSNNLQVFIFSKELELPNSNIKIVEEDKIAF